MYPQQHSRSKNSCNAVRENVSFVILDYILLHAQKHRGTNKRARSVTAVAREEGRGARSLGDEAT